jgi:integrase/recombinase XerD
MSRLAPTLQAFFTSYLNGQKGASYHTISAYRDSWRLLLGYLRDRQHLNPDRIDFTDLDAETIIGFLAHLEQDRGNSPATRNARLVAIHAVFHYASYTLLEHAELIARVLAIAPKRTATADISYLTDAEVDAVLAAPPTTRWVGRRDQLMILTLITAGLRVSELTATTWTDAQLQPPSYLRCHGKGRKDRTTPLTSATTRSLQAWQKENHDLGPDGPLFPAQGTRRAMTQDAVTQRLAVHTTTAAVHCPTLTGKDVTPHVLRHTCAMRMLAAGIDAATISLWLGHESLDSIRPYLHADMRIKQRALDRTTPPNSKPGTYKPTGALLKFLENL